VLSYTLFCVLFTIQFIDHWSMMKKKNVHGVLLDILLVCKYLIPFSVNFISSIVIIINVARVRSKVHKNQSYKQHLRKQFREQTYSIITPIILVLFGIPRLIISFLSGCMESVRDPCLFLFGYFISFLPLVLISIIFILPSETYRKELKVVLKSARKTILRR
jgi:uncharacterized membrane protein